MFTICFCFLRKEITWTQLLTNTYIWFFGVGWKVLLTSRNDEVHPHCETFKPKLLTHDECWTLLQMIAFPKNDTTSGMLFFKDYILLTFLDRQNPIYSLSLLRNAV